MDLLEVARMERALHRRPALAQRLFSDAEIAYAEARVRPATHLAARFCAKEAAVKALGLEVWGYRDVEVVPGKTGPRLALGGVVADQARLLGVEVVVSLTHDRSIAGATALLIPAAEDST